MSSILDTSTLYSTYASSIQNAKASSLQKSLENTGTDKEKDAEALMDACKGFEAYFVQKIIEQTKKSILDDEEEDGEYMKYFGDLMNEQYANLITESGGVGLAQQLYDSMKANYQL
ncbi:MAG: rod-binding protein [Lachnospiraceae bacterium]|nr:rod-binding protein [Lachnospiraceae bacterium]